jgi:hypothetical protein
MAAHSMMGEKMSGVPAPVLNALRAGLPLPDAKLQALSVFTRVMVASRGKPTRQDLQAFLVAGFRERQVLEIILAIAVKTISNYSNHVFHTDVDPKFPGLSLGDTEGGLESAPGSSPRALEACRTVLLPCRHAHRLA